MKYRGSYQNVRGEEVFLRENQGSRFEVGVEQNESTLYVNLFRRHHMKSGMSPMKVYGFPLTCERNKGVS